ncbi:DNA topoisomerase [Sulfurimonas sp.]|uniref:DNA topoisomerase n=1 Tax=Sulfurimonas sp. TaxID=2022749 RepID=UPI0025D479F9|nr:DNA topoisomerase [Sulfurimonas sp.]MBW6487463.1 hypothetical protein [Sulfurimonas sp.]
MLTKEKIESEINKLLHEKLFSAIRKIIVEKQKEALKKTSEYKNSSNKKEMLENSYKIWFEKISKFFLSFRTVYALVPLVERELKIREFSSEEIIRIKTDYSYDGIEFSAYYPAHYNHSLQKEMEDCIDYLKENKQSHIVDNYIPKKDTERSPHKPLTTAELKYSAFYLFGFEPNYVTVLAQKLHQANLITEPETNGWNIDDAFAEEMITILNQTFSEDIVLQYKRRYTDKIVDRTQKECIRPIHISSKYFPKVVSSSLEFNSIFFEDEQLSVDVQKLYEFIFYITLSTQLKNSVYDTSKIEIVVGNKKLYEQANAIIDGQENWEILTGELIKRISNNDGSFSGNIVVLPEIQPGEILKPIDIYPYSYQSKRPPRFGVGRFVTQILEKNNIGSNKEHDKIINELIDSRAVNQVKSMLHPQESAIILIQWLTQHLPSFVDLEYLTEFEEKIKMVEVGKITLNSLLEELKRIIETAFKMSGYIEKDGKPSQSKINLIKAIAQKYNLKLDNAVFDSNIKIDMLLAQYNMPEPIKVGSCPNCNALIYQKEFINRESGEVSHYFACENFKKNGGCTFSMWDNYVYKFFSDKAMEFHSVEERADALKKILSKKRGYLFNDFIAKNQKPYDAKVLIESYKDRKTQQEKWGFTLAFVNKK